MTAADRTWTFACPEQSKPLLRALIYLLTLTSLGSQVDSQIWALSSHDSFENFGNSETGAFVWDNCGNTWACRLENVCTVIRLEGGPLCLNTAFSRSWLHPVYREVCQRQFG